MCLSELWHQSQYDNSKIDVTLLFWGENFVVHNGGYEKYTGEKKKTMPRDTLNLLMPDFSGAMLS